MASAKKYNPIASFDVLSGLAQELDAPLKSLANTSQKLLDNYKSRNFEYISYKDFKGIILTDRKSTRLNSSHLKLSRMPSSA